MQNQQPKKVEDSEEQNEDQNESTKKLSKGQKKKLRQQKKKQQQKQKQSEAVKQPEKTEASKDGVKSQATQETQKKQQAKQGKQDKKEQKKDDKKKKGGKVNAAALLAKKRLDDLQKFQEEQQRKRKEREAQQQRIRKQEQQKKRRQQQQKDRIAKQEQQRIRKLKKSGLYMTKKQQEKMNRAKIQFEQVKKDKQHAQLVKEGKAQETKEPQKQKTEQEVKRQQQKKQKLRKKQQKLLKDDKSDFQLVQGKYRSPVCCILGHVDTGKTTLLDKIRRTNVQQGEAGGITQQIGATFFPQAKLIEDVSKCKQILDVEVEVPGLLIIDTPGHESFSNLRSRGSSLCDVAILVIDIQHGLEKQTLESLQLLKKGGTPFVVALNKIDRSYGWQPLKDGSSYQSLQKQNRQAFHDYNTKLEKVILQLNTKGYNAALYWQNQDPDEFISLIPTSGITGEGIPDLLANIVNMSLTSEKISQRIQVKKDKFKCTVMEVKMIEGYGTTIDCLLIDGSISKQDQIVLLGFNGPIVTKVKAILTPHPMKEMRIKDQYIHHEKIFAANGVKIAANGLDQAVAGSPLIVARTEEEVEEAKIICGDQFKSIQKKFKLEALGVGVSASTLGSLQALLEYLKTQKIPVSHISVGPVSKQDVIKAMKSLLSQVPERRKEQFACLLVFDVKVLADAQKYAEDNGIKIFTANIIYHLTDFFSKHVAAVKLARKQKEGKQAVFPCILKQVATFRKSDPIVLGVDVEQGVLKIGTPICIYKQNELNGDKQLKLGVVESIEHNHKKLTQARKKNGSVAISIGGDPSIMSGRHFDPKDMLCSQISRKSIDCLKQHFKPEVTEDQWKLIIRLKKFFNVA